MQIGRCPDLKLLLLQLLLPLSCCVWCSPPVRALLVHMLFPDPSSFHSTLFVLSRFNSTVRQAYHLKPPANLARAHCQLGSGGCLRRAGGRAVDLRCAPAMLDHAHTLLHCKCCIAGRHQQTDLAEVESQRRGTSTAPGRRHMYMPPRQRPCQHKIVFVALIWRPLSTRVRLTTLIVRRSTLWCRSCCQLVCAKRLVAAGALA